MELVHFLVPVLTLTTVGGIVETLAWRRKAKELEAELIAAWDALDRSEEREEAIRGRLIRELSARERFESESG